MKSYSIYYHDKYALQSFIAQNKIENSTSLLIQVFSAVTQENYIQRLISELTELLPDAVLIGTTTDGQISDGRVSRGEVVINFTQFEHTTLHAAGIAYKRDDGYESGKFLAEALIGEETKLLIAFVDGLHTNGESFLEGISSVNEKIAVAGGYAGDNCMFEKTLVFTKEAIYKSGAVAVSLNNKHLNIHTGCSRNWFPIGSELTVTKAEGNRLYEIEGKSAVEIYSYYLSDALAQALPASGVEFPLIVNREGKSVARVCTRKEDDGSLILSGSIHNGEKVKIGFGNFKDIVLYSKNIVDDAANKPSEAIFVYSCMTRKYLMGREAEEEILPLQNIAPVSGFLTYGEFFTSEKKEFFNQAMTFVSLSESDEVGHNVQAFEVEKVDRADSSLDALIHLIHLTGKEVGERMQHFKQSTAINEMFKERMELALYGSNQGVFDWDMLNDTIYYSPRWKELIGFSDDEFANTIEAWESRVYPEDLEVCWEDVKKHLNKETEYFENTYRLRHKDGHWVWILAKGKAIFNAEGDPVRMIGTHTDITEEKLLELKSQEQSQVIEQIHDGVIRTNMDGIILSWNPGAESIFGYKADEVIGKHISIIYRPEDRPFFEEVREALYKDGIYSADLHYLTKSHETISVALSLTLLKDENGIPVGMIGINQDVTEKKRAEALLEKQNDMLYYQAHYDAMTGLPNRMLFMDRLKQAVIKADRNKSKVALLFIDVDKFKQINDSLGHLVGDKVLKIISERLASSIRKGDTLARLSGDEFTMIIEELHDEQDLVILAQKLLELMIRPMHIDGHEIYLSLSIGISIYPDDSIQPLELLKYADTAMYKAKELGRNNFQFYSSEMTEHALDRMHMKTSIKQAIQRDEFVVFYQSKIDALSGKIIGLEALVRWQHPTKGLLLPESFIPLAEETGMVIEIDRLVYGKVIKQVSKWQKEGLFDGIVALNLTIKQFEYAGFVDELKAVIDKYDFKPNNLELEISETHLMKSPKYVIDRVEQLNTTGIRISIDDFGTGYSSLSLLKRLPIHQLKIDRTFVRSIPDDKESVGIIEAIIVLGKSLKIDIIAEGVETSEQKEFLIEHGCVKMQGKYFSRPLQMEEMEKVLKM